MLFLFSSLFVIAQDAGEVEMQRVTDKEWNLEIFLNTNGGGIGFQKGKTPNYFDKHFWEVNFLYNQHPKAVRAQNINFPGGKSYSYGKQYDLFMLRGGYGYQRILNHKPYWGGVQARYSLSVGACLGMGLPIVLNVYIPNEKGELTMVEERYDPENPNHTINYIVGRSHFFKGIGQTALRPGFYAKTGINFDFSKDLYTIHAVEVGASVDMVFPFIQQMAHNKTKPFYLCAYIAYHFGKKKAYYE